MNKIVRLFGLFGLAMAAAAAAQEPKAPASAGKPGDFVPADFRAYIVADDRFPPLVNPPKSPDDRDPRDRTNKIHDLVIENGLAPVVAVFVRADPKDITPTSGAGKLAAALDKLLPEYRGDKLAAFVVFLRLEGMPKSVTVKNPDGTEAVVELDAEYPDDENRDQYATAIRDLAAGVKAPNVVFALAPAKSKAAAAWGIGDADEVTVVIYNRLRVKNRWTFKAADGPTDAQVQEIVAATEEMVGGKKKVKD